MATSKEDLQNTVPISAEEREGIETAIRVAIGDGYSVRVVGEPDQSADNSDYAIAVIKKMEG